MQLYRPSDLLKFLDEYKLKPTKRFSQTFLIDQNILNKIIKLAKLQPRDLVLEIGPGPGALTQKLLQQGANVIAVEKDKGFANALSRLHDLGSLKIIEQDVLKLSFEQILKEKTKIIANLPYNITSPLLTKILQNPLLISSATIMVQKEVAKRICATKNSKDYSHLSIFMQLLSDVTYGFDVKPNSFFPKPKIDSAVIQFFPKNIKIPESFFAFTKTAFHQKRKMLRSSLASLFQKSTIEQALETLYKPITARPQELTPADFLKLFELLTNKTFAFFSENNSN